MTASTYKLARPSSAEEWARYHQIRRVELFEGKGRFGIYDPNHPDDTHPGNVPFLFFKDDEPVGTVRIDIKSEARRAAMRLIAVDRPWQGKGLGKILMEHAEHYARECGCTASVLNAHEDVVDFYLKCGYHREAWPDDAQMLLPCVQMRKML